MPSSPCSFDMTCSPDTTPSSFSSFDHVGKTVGIIIGSLFGFAFLICILIIIYLALFKAKPRAQIWTHPYSTSQPYRQPVVMFPYANYPQAPRPQPQSNSQRISEDAPPAYEEIQESQEVNAKI